MVNMTQYKNISKVQKTATDDGFTFGTWYYITYVKSGKIRKVNRLPKEAERQIGNGTLSVKDTEVDKCKDNVTYITTRYA